MPNKCFEQNLQKNVENKKVNIAIEFYAFKIVWVTNFSLSRRLNLTKGISSLFAYRREQSKLFVLSSVSSFSCSSCFDFFYPLPSA